MTLDEVRRLHEHPARSAGRVVDLAVVRLDDLDDELDDRRRGEELAAFLALCEGELAEEVLIDEPEAVALERVGQPAKQAEQLDQHGARQPGVRARQHAVEVRVRALDRRHRVVDGFPEIRAFRQADEAVETRLVRQVQHTSGVIVGGADLAAAGTATFKLLVHSREAEVRIAEEDEPQDGRRVLRRPEAGIRPKLVSRLPQAVLQLSQIGRHRSPSLLVRELVGVLDDTFPHWEVVGCCGSRASRGALVDAQVDLDVAKPCEHR